jgi:hypothetical protein
MSWDRDEMAAFLESIDNLVDALRSQQQNNGYGTQGTPDPSTATLPQQGGRFEVDLEPIKDFTRAVSEATPQVRLFGRSLEITVEKVAETIQAFTTLQGAVGGLNAKAGQNVATGASGAIGGATINLPSGSVPAGNPSPADYNFRRATDGLTPRQRKLRSRKRKLRKARRRRSQRDERKTNQEAERLQKEREALAAQQKRAAEQVENTRKSRSRRRIRRRRMKNLVIARQSTRSLNHIIQGSIVGGLFGGPRGALFGAGLGALRGVGVGTPLASAAVGMGLAIATAPMLIHRESREAIDEARPFAAFGPGVIPAMVKLDLNQFHRNIELARDTAETTVELTNAVDKMEQAFLPYQKAWTNLKNRTLSFGAQLVTDVLENPGDFADPWHLGELPWLNWFGAGDRRRKERLAAEAEEKKKREQRNFIPEPWLPPKVAPQVRVF